MLVILYNVTSELMGANMSTKLLWLPLLLMSSAEKYCRTSSTSSLDAKSSVRTGFEGSSREHFTYSVHRQCTTGGRQHVPLQYYVITCSEETHHLSGIVSARNNLGREPHRVTMWGTMQKKRGKKKKMGGWYNMC